MKVKSLSCVQLFATPWTVAYQGPQSMGFSRHGVLEVGCHFLLQGMACAKCLHVSCLSFLVIILVFCLNLLILNGRIMALHHCVGFCHVPTWISHRYMYVPSLVSLPPTSQPVPHLWVVTEHCIWAPSTSLWTQSGEERVGRIERVTLKHRQYQT